MILSKLKVRGDAIWSLNLLFKVFDCNKVETIHVFNTSIIPRNRSINMKQIARSFLLCISVLVTAIQGETEN